jgi:hypothetical protein
MGGISMAELTSGMQRTLAALVALIVVTMAVSPSDASSRRDRYRRTRESMAEVEGLVWAGDDSLKTYDDLAALCAPILWFSPDEPLIEGSMGKDIRMPMAFPFEDQADAPVVYYRIRRLLVREAAEGYAPVTDPADPGGTVLDISRLAGMDLDFFFYYPTEEGFGGHDHDVESVEMKVFFGKRESTKDNLFGMVVWKVVAKAHGVLWYDNTLEVDEYTRFPLSILVEEGKHASCTDKNMDGYYTPGYDVNRRINDAWGVRDIIRSGGLRTGGWESWMAKVRTDNSMVLPPLPDDSPHREQFVEDGVYASGFAVYEIRPFPDSENAADDLKPFIDSKGYPEWPEHKLFDDMEQVSEWFIEESFMKSFSIAYRFDGDHGLSFTFPLFIVKNFEEPMSGGWIVNRIYFKDHKLKDIGYNLLYTTSASRWVDGYFAVGFEIDSWDTPDGREHKTLFVTEPGLKFRANLKHSPLSFLTKTGIDFWGLRFGVKYTGTWSFTDIGYVVEVGAGVW